MSVSKAEVIFRGNGVSPGIALGSALKLDSYHRVMVKTSIDSTMVEEEIRRIYHAIEVSLEQLNSLRLQLEKRVGPEHSFILDAYVLMLEDRSLISDVVAIIREQHTNAEWAVRQATDKIRDAYLSLDDEYFRERVSDIENVVERLLLNLSGDQPFRWTPLPQDLVIATHDFDPSIFATMDLERVRALALESGGRTSHTAIIARSLRLPAVMEVRGFLQAVTPGDLLLVNGDEGLLILHPSDQRIRELGPRLEEARQGMLEAPPLHSGILLTEDGSRISLQANIELPHEASAARKSGAEGIGLFRSEFLFFAHPRGLPSMGEQLETYGMMAQEMAPYPVAIRTLDAGADKVWRPGAEHDSETNPSMGLRGLRLSLTQARTLFAEQIEAVLRAGVHGKLEIVLPMVSTVEELWEAKRIIEEVRTSVEKSRDVNLAEVPIGAMIEVPAAVLTIEHLAQEVDFLCVGTNDLIQYMLAVDRDNPKVAHLYQPLHPSILHSMARIASVARRLNKPARICGEMSCNPFFAILFLGMGYERFSMNSQSIPTIRRILRQVTASGAKEIVEKAMKLGTTGEIARLLIEEVSRLVQVDLSPFVKELGAPGDIGGGASPG